MTSLKAAPEVKPRVNPHPTTEAAQHAEIRARLQSASSHPNAITVSVKNNEATLTGTALENETSTIESAVRSIAGIKEIQNRLSILHLTHVQTEHEFVQPSLSPLLRLFLGIFGGSLALYGVRRRDIAGILFSGIGLGAIVRSVTNIDTSSLFDRVLHHPVKLQRTIDLDVPIDVAFDFWKDFSNYSRFMSYVQEVKVNEKQGFTWTVMGPAGIPIHWDAQLSELIPNQLIAWTSLPRAFILNSGHIFFRSRDQGTKTRIDVTLNYEVPAGILGQEVIRALGFDPKTRIDGDLLIMKTLMEQEYGVSTPKKPHQLK